MGRWVSWPVLHGFWPGIDWKRMCSNGGFPTWAFLKVIFFPIGGSGFLGDFFFFLWFFGPDFKFFHPPSPAPPFDFFPFPDSADAPLHKELFTQTGFYHRPFTGSYPLQRIFFNILLPLTRVPTIEVRPNYGCSCVSSFTPFFFFSILSSLAGFFPPQTPPHPFE